MKQLEIFNQATVIFCVSTWKNILKRINNSDHLCGIQNGWGLYTISIPMVKLKKQSWLWNTNEVPFSKLVCFLFFYPSLFYFIPECERKSTHASPLLQSICICETSIWWLEIFSLYSINHTKFIIIWYWYDENIIIYQSHRR